MDVKVVAELLHELNGKSHADLLNALVAQMFNPIGKAHNALADRLAAIEAHLGLTPSAPPENCSAPPEECCGHPEDCSDRGGPADPGA